MIKKIAVTVLVSILLVIMKRLLGVEITGGALEVFVYTFLYGISLIMVSYMFYVDRECLKK